MDIYELIALRKSVREFLDKPVPDEILERLLNAARLAPSAHNQQEWRFVVVTDPGLRSQLIEAANDQEFVGQAPVVLACCAETDNRVMSCNQACYPIDVSIAIDHITLAAAHEGLGSCWIGAFNEQKVKDILNIPQHIRVVELLPIGYPADPAPVKKFRLPLNKITKQNTWQ